MSDFNDNFEQSNHNNVPNTDRTSIGLVLLNEACDVLIVQRPQDDGLWQMPEFPVERETDVKAAVTNAVSFLSTNAKAMIIDEVDGWIEEIIPDYVAKQEGLTGQSTGQQKWFALKLISSLEKFDLTNTHNYAYSKWVSLSDVPSLVAPYKRVIYKTLSETFKTHAQEKKPKNIRDDFKADLSSLS